MRFSLKPLALYDDEEMAVVVSQCYINQTVLD